MQSCYGKQFLQNFVKKFENSYLKVHLQQDCRSMTINLCKIQTHPFTQFPEYLNPKKAGKGQFHSPVFRNMCLLEKDENLFLCDFWYYHKSHLFWKFHGNSSNRSKDMKVFPVNINYFHRFSGFFLPSLVTKNVMTSAYNRWCQHFSLTTNFE